MNEENELFDFSNLPARRKKQIVDDRRNILILELPGTKEGEQKLREIWEELRDRGYVCKME
jgi:hypothetical protein